MKKIFKLFSVIAAVALLTFLFTQHNKSNVTDLSDNKDINEEKESGGAADYFQFENEMRAFPNKEIPSDKFFKAFEYSKSSIKEFDNGDSPTQWTSIGPNNIGGRSLCIAINPADTSMLFMGSASGGLWKSTTGGIGANAWTYVETGYPSLAASYIAIDSANPNIMYLATGENYGYQYSKNGLDIRVTRGMYGIGILKTTDAGATWTKSLDWSYNNERGVWRVVMNPKNHNVLYAATSEGVYKSNNAGGTWTQVLNYLMVMDLKINPADTATVYISIGDLSIDVPNANVGIYKTSNSGGTWTKLAGGLPASWSGKASLDLVPGTPGTIFASIGNDPNQGTSYLGLWASTDGGATWTQKVNYTSLMTNQGWYNNAFIVKPGDPNSFLIGNLDVYRSTNGGATLPTKMSDWQGWNTGATPPGQPESSSSNFSHADQHFFAVNPRDPNKFYSITDGGLYRSNDFGTTYYSCNGGYVTTQFYNGFGNSPTDTNYAIGGLQDNRAAFYQGTTAWYKTFQGDGFWCAVNQTSPSIVYTEYSYGDISRSNNGGVSWSDIAPPGTGSESSCCFVAPYICCRSNPSIIYAGNTAIYRSANGGSSWAGPYGSFSGAKVLTIDGSATFTDTVYCGTIPVSGGANATIWKTTNGTTWNNVGSGLPIAYPTDIHVNPNNSMDVYVTFSGFGNPHVFRSSNGGGAWQNITGNLPDVPHESIVIDPLYTQNIYVGNDLGVYFSTNNGVTWYSYNGGMPYALVFDLTIVYPNRHIRATTHGHGVYERSLVQNPVAITPIGTSVPKSFNLYQNYPNPFNPETKIKFDVPQKGNVPVRIVVFDVNGKQVRELVNRNMNAGSYELSFDASGISSGIYFYKLTAGDFVSTKKMILVK